MSEYTIDQIMSMKISDWPTPLIEYTMFCMSYIGFCGDVLAGCAEDWINANYPENVAELKLAFLVRLYPARSNKE